MTEKKLYRWTGEGKYRDHRNDRTIETGETVELQPNIGDTQREMVLVEENNNQENQETETQQQSKESTGSSDPIESEETTETNQQSNKNNNTPEILQGLDEQNIRDMEYGELQELGKQFDDIDASGKMEELEDALVQKL